MLKKASVLLSFFLCLILGQASQARQSEPEANSIKIPERRFSTSYSSTIERNALTPEIEKEDEQQPERESGHARKEQSERPSWEKDQLNAEQAILKSQFDTAASLLERALREAKNSPTKPSRLALTRLALATIYLKQERYPEAFKAFELSDNKLRCELSPDSKEYARCQIGLARCLVEFGKEEKAIEHAKKAIAILKKGNQTNSQLYGYCLHTLAMANARHGWSEEARPLFTEALEIFDKYPGFKRLDLARILRDQAIFHYRLGSRKLSKELYEKSSKIKEQAMVSEQPAAIAGEVRFVWEPGSTRSCEIIDNEFPFRYITVGGVRVAATVVDLWELIAVLITVTNVSDQQSEYELGKVRLSLVSKVSPISEPVVVAPVDHNSIDRIRKERNMWDLTLNRPWLANIQKTRSVRGLVPHQGHDLFRGPNVFGVYGQWKAVSHSVPERMSVHPSREGLTSGVDVTDVKLPGLLRNNHSSYKHLVNVTMEPFESRTGELFYLNPRDQDIVIEVPVGNTIFELPFHTRKQKIP